MASEFSIIPIGIPIGNKIASDDEVLLLLDVMDQSITEPLHGPMIFTHLGQEYS